MSKIFTAIKKALTRESTQKRLLILTANCPYCDKPIRVTAKTNADQLHLLPPLGILRRQADQSHVAKSGRQYADDVRELRAQGIDFPGASRGYILADAANWSSGQKAAVTRAINQFDFTEFDAQEEAKRKRKRKPKKRKPRAAPLEEIIADRGLEPETIGQFFDDAVGDNDEEWDDILYFDFDEADDLIDEENDNYDEAPT